MAERKDLGCRGPGGCSGLNGSLCGRSLTVVASAVLPLDADSLKPEIVVDEPFERRRRGTTGRFGRPSNVRSPSPSIVALGDGVWA